MAIIDYCPPRKGITSTSGTRLATITNLRNWGYTGLASSSKIADIDSMLKAGVPYSKIMACLDSTEQSQLTSYMNSHHLYLFGRKLSQVKEILTYYGGSQKTTYEESYPNVFDETSMWAQDYSYLISGNGSSPSSLSGLSGTVAWYELNYNDVDYIKYSSGDPDDHEDTAGILCFHNAYNGSSCTHDSNSRDYVYILNSTGSGGNVDFYIGTPYYDGGYSYYESDIYWTSANTNYQYVVKVWDGGGNLYEYDSSGNYVDYRSI